MRTTSLTRISERSGVRTLQRCSVQSLNPLNELKRYNGARSARLAPSARFNVSTFLTLLTVLTFSTLPTPAALLQTQTFRLNPGWNSIFLELQPTNNTPTSVLGNLPVQSLWTYADRSSGVEFIQNPNEPIANRSQWLLFLPTNRVESFQNSLHRLVGNRAYLVELAGTAPATLNVTGIPSLRPVEWATDGYTLRGLPVDAAKPPSFAAFFGGSPAHYDRALRRLQPMYRLGADGRWVLADAEDKIAPGEAYWIFSKNASDYSGPVELRLPSGDTLDFGATTEAIRLEIKNNSFVTNQVRLAELGNSVTAPLRYATFDRVNGSDWLPMFTTNAPVFTITLAPQQTRELRLTVERTRVPPSGYASVLALTDSQGLRRLIPVQARLTQAAAVALQSAATSSSGVVRKSSLPGAGTSAAISAAGLAGLWFGSATINGVSEVHSGTLATNATKGVTRSGVNPLATRTANDFTLRLIVHVDTNGTARLLKDVIQMRTLPSYTNALDGRRVVSNPGRIVLVTDERLIPTLAGTDLRGGQPVARRLSSADFDFPAAPESNYVRFDGTFGLGSTVAARLVLGADFPTNPFKHKYHPDHDNLTANYRDFQAEAYGIDREVRLTLSEAPTDGKANPAYGYSQLEGQYSETVKGLHRQAIEVGGSFTLRRLSDVGVLNK